MNADYWLNCNENIDDLEELERGLVYVPIANYKVVNEVGNRTRRINGIRYFFA